MAAAAGRRGGTLGPGLVRPGRLYAVGEEQVGIGGGGAFLLLLEENDREHGAVLVLLYGDG